MSGGSGDPAESFTAPAPPSSYRTLERYTTPAGSGRGEILVIFKQERSPSVTAAFESSWRKSSACSNDSNCVEMARVQASTLGVRDSKNGTDGPVLAFSVAEFTDFLARIRAGALDRG